MSFLLPAWLGGRRSDAYEDALRSRAARLSRYITALQRERAALDAFALRRAGELAALSADCRRRLALVHSWGLFDLLETFYRQSVLLMRRGYLRAAADAAAGAALDEQLVSAEKLRARALRDAEERAEELASPAGRLGQAPSRSAADAETLDLEGFCAPPAALRRASPSLPRLRSREAALTRELLALDEVLRGLAGELAEPSADARAAALARAVADEEARAREDAAAAAGVAASLEDARRGGVPVRAAAAWALPLLCRGDELRGCDFEAEEGPGAAALRALLLRGCAAPPGGGADAEAAALPAPARAALDAALAALRRACGAVCERRAAAAARAHDFDRWLCDQRFKEGRLLQSWSARVLAVGWGGEGGGTYAFGLHRFLTTFDPGPEYYLAALRRAGVGAALARVAFTGAPCGGGGEGGCGGDGGATAAPPTTPAPPPAPLPRRGAAAASPGAAYALLASPPPAPPPPRGRLPQPRLVASFLDHLVRDLREGRALKGGCGEGALRALVGAAVYPRLKALVFSGVEVLPQASSGDGGAAAKGGAAAAAAAVLPLPPASAAYARRGDGVWGEGEGGARPTPAAGVPLPCPPGSAAYIIRQRDEIWLLKRPLAGAMGAEALGLPPAFTAPLPADAPGGLFAPARALLDGLADHASPVAMLNALLDAVDVACAEAGERAVRGGRGGAGGPLAADALIPLLVFCASRAPALRRPHACIAYMAHYGLPPSGVGGRADYALCTLQMVVSFVCTQRVEVRIAGTPGEAPVVEGYAMPRAAAAAAAQQQQQRPPPPAQAPPPPDEPQPPPPPDEPPPPPPPSDDGEEAYAQFADAMLRALAAGSEQPQPPVDAHPHAPTPPLSLCGEEPRSPSPVAAIGRQRSVAFSLGGDALEAPHFSLGRFVFAAALAAGGCEEAGGGAGGAPPAAPSPTAGAAAAASGGSGNTPSAGKSPANRPEISSANLARMAPEISSANLARMAGGGEGGEEEEEEEEEEAVEALYTALSEERALFAPAGDGGALSAGVAAAAGVHGARGAGGELRLLRAIVSEQDALHGVLAMLD
jgi:hypothetical protein